MHPATHTIHPSVEEKATLAFSAQSFVFDELYGKDGMIRYKRDRVRKHVESFLLPGSRILELNAGTGVDAIYFAAKGHSVHATDVSKAMLDQLSAKLPALEEKHRPGYEVCSYHNLGALQEKGPYDHIFSNFAGLNCSNDIRSVLHSLPQLLEPGGKITLVVLPEFCLWEFLLLFKGKFKTALRRLFAKKGAAAKVEGYGFTCWYYNPSYIIKNLGNSFELLSLEGLCTIVPPSYIEGFDIKYPRLFRFLCNMESRWAHKWPFRSIGDYFIITLKKKEE